MAKRKGPDRSHFVTAIDPVTNKPATMTRKAFDGVYREKGFDLVDRDNVDDVEPARRSRDARRRELGADDGDGAGQTTGSAADVASKLNLEGEGGKKNAGNVDNKGAVSEGRQPSGRNRGGR